MLLLAGSDYIPLDQQTLTFDMNTRAAKITINIIDDGEFEGNEQLYVHLTTLDSGITLPRVPAIVRIMDDDRNGHSHCMMTAVHSFYFMSLTISLVLQLFYSHFMSKHTWWQKAWEV